MPPVAFIVAAIGLLVVWVVFVPMLVAINIQSLSAVVKKVRAGQRENLGKSWTLWSCIHTNKTEAG